MKWTVKGADPATGRDRVTTVEAPDAAEAERRANAGGMLVSSVDPFVASAVAVQAAAPGRGPKPDGPPVVCPNRFCGYKGPAARRPVAPGPVDLVVRLLGALPGRPPTRPRAAWQHVCPRCNSPVKA